jgi:hypothetical protein
MNVATCYIYPIHGGPGKIVPKLRVNEFGSKYGQIKSRGLVLVRGDNNAVVTHATLPQLDQLEFDLKSTHQYAGIDTIVIKAPGLQSITIRPSREGRSRDIQIEGRTVQTIVQSYPASRDLGQFLGIQDLMIVKRRNVYPPLISSTAEIPEAEDRHIKIVNTDRLRKYKRAGADISKSHNGDIVIKSQGSTTKMPNELGWYKLEIRPPSPKVNVGDELSQVSPNTKTKKTKPVILAALVPDIYSIRAFALNDGYIETGHDVRVISRHKTYNGLLQKRLS